MSVHKDSSTGMWKVRYRVGVKQHAKSGFKTKRDAEAYESEQLRRLRSGTWTDPGAARLGMTALFEDWLSSKHAEPRTLQDYRSVWHKRIEPTWGSMRVCDVTPAGVQRWASELASKYAPSSVNHAVTVFRQVMSWAVMEGRIEVNPVRRATDLTGRSLVPRGGVAKERIYLTAEQVDALCLHAGKSALLIEFMAYTGLRWGEATALQWRDVDLMRNRIIVRRAWSDVNGTLLERLPKSGKEREVPIAVRLREPLSELLAAYVGTADGLVFAAPEGGLLRKANWQARVFHPARKSAGITEAFTPHGLRHTFAALSVQAGVNPKVLQRVMGHSSITVTLDTYGHMFPSDLDALAEAFAKPATTQATAHNVPEMFPIAAVTSLR